MEETAEKYNLRVTEDKMSVILDCDLSIGELEMLVVDIGKELETLGIKVPSEQNKIKEQLNQAAKENPHLVDFVLVKGEPPVPPQHGWVDWDGDFFNTGFVADKETGKVNYREKAARESVTKGTLLGRQVPVKEGKDGLDVFGKPIPTEEPITYYPGVGGNVRLDTNNNTYYAEKDGRVRLINDILYVDEVYIIEEDVNIETGNISHTGVVIVNRDVLGGAKIEAVGNIEVHGIIENAEIRAKGNLTAHGGIRQAEGHKVVVEGGINAKYIDGGDIEAKGDIVVEKEIINSTLKTLGAVMIPKGRIMGGETVALRGIFVGRSGSKFTDTVLVAGEDFSIRGKRNLINIKKKRIEDELTQNRKFADSQMVQHKAAFIHSQDELVKSLLKITKLEQELQNIVEEEEDLKSKSQDRAKKLVVAEQGFSPKTTICIDDEKFVVENEYGGPIKAEIVDGKIRLGCVDRGED